MTIQEAISPLEELAPRHLAESYDNVGLLVGLAQAECTGVLFSLDCTEAVVAEARALNANLIVSHHPIWFGSRKHLLGDDYVSRTLMQAIRHDIALYACHTNLDNIASGVNLALGTQLGLQDLQILAPQPPDMSTGAGMLGTLPEAMTVPAFLAQVSRALGTPYLRWAGAQRVQSVKQVAICGGSGSFLIPRALAAGADALLTGDITYHKFFDGEERLLLVDAGHAETEQFVPALLKDCFMQKFRSFAAYLSKVPTNPVQYYIHGENR
ncbi:MAG: Nif3-like dinuclear metal center hexameric protein [Bacteroidetes bacterium]|nr:Nif3-like dinuclear metal center hexameric protein [Bacteroidota bacterium]